MKFTDSSATMDENTVKHLIRLKRYEQPEEGYFDAFLRDFHHRQRQELLKGSSLSLLMERLNTYLSDPHSQGWAFAPVLAVFLLTFYCIIGMTDDSPLPEMPSLAQVQGATPDYLEMTEISPVSWRGPVTLLGHDRLIPENDAPVSHDLTPSGPFGERIRLNFSENELMEESFWRTAH